MDKTNLEIVREAVIKAVPEIIELKFGCRVKGIANHLPPVEGEIAFFVEEPPSFIVNSDFGLVGNYTKEDLNVIGRPIRLADVTYTISRTKHASNVLFDSMGGYWEIYMRDEDAVLKQQFPARWNLLKDDLSMQSPQALEFLAKLLK